MANTVRPRLNIVERRKTERTATSLMGSVIRADGVRVPCCIKNVSDTGVMLEFTGGVFVLQPKFEFCLENADQRYPVKLVWRKGRRVGVVFC